MSSASMFRLVSVFLLPRRPPGPLLFPYTTLFRSRWPLAMVFPAGFSPSAHCRRPPTDSLFHRRRISAPACPRSVLRSEEHTSELQSRLHLVCSLLLEKKKTLTTATQNSHRKRIIH